MVYRYNKILFNHKKREKKHLSFAKTWINLEGIMLSEESQIEKEKYCMFSPYVESKKIWTQRNRVEWWLPGARGGENGKILAKGYQLPAIRWESSGVLIYSMVTIINSIVLYVVNPWTTRVWTVCPLVHEFISLNIQLDLLILHPQIHQTSHWRQYFRALLGNLQMPRADCTHCSTPSYIRDLSMWGVE